MSHQLWLEFEALQKRVAALERSQGAHYVAEYEKAFAESQAEPTARPGTASELRHADPADRDRIMREAADLVAQDYAPGGALNLDTQPEPDYRNGEQTNNVVQMLEWAESAPEQTRHGAACFREAIRRVRAWKKAREKVVHGGMAKPNEYVRRWKEELLALLDGEHAEEGK